MILRLGFLATAVLCAGLAVSATTASNTVPTSHAAKLTRTITANDIKPSACSGITIADLVVGSGTITGGSANDLILGSSGNDTLGVQNNGGSDCCVGGGGTTTYKNSCTVKQ